MCQNVEKKKQNKVSSMFGRHHNYFIITRIRNVPMPCRAYRHDAGIDFFVPEFDEDFVKDFTELNRHTHISVRPRVCGNKIIVPPGGSVMIPSGIKAVIPPGYALVFFNRSSVASQKKLVFGAHVVDSSYRGEIIINLLNISKSEAEIKEKEKVIQGILLPVLLLDPVEVPQEVYDGVFSNTDRKADGFGSTDNIQK